MRGRLVGISSREGKLLWYHDPLPTNCVGDWVCAGGTGAGYPEYAYSSGPECGYKNLAVFFNACSFNCLYCQNWHFRKETFEPLTTLLTNSFRMLMKRLRVFAISGATSRLNPLLLSGHRDWLLSGKRAGFSGYAGKQTAP